MKLKALIKRLEKDKAEFHDTEVEFIITTKEDGQIVAMKIENQAPNVVKALKLFGRAAADKPNRRAIEAEERREARKYR